MSKEYELGFNLEGAASEETAMSVIAIRINLGTMARCMKSKLGECNNW
jgi:hypothetical protein